MASYSLLVPLAFDFDYDFPKFELLSGIKINSFVISIKKLGGSSYTLKFGSFNSESDAADFYPKIQSYLYWISLNCRIGIKFPNSVLINSSNLLASSDSDSNAYIINDDIDLRFAYGFSPTSIVTPSAKNISSSLEECMAFNYPEKIQEDNKLRLALELYSNYFFESSGYARFITLVNILEALAPSLGDEKISEFSQNQLNEIVDFANNKRDGHDEKCDKYLEINSLIKRIEELKNKGTTSMLLNYIKQNVKKNPSLGEPNKVKEKVDEAYNLRSRLLHGDNIDQLQLGTYLSFLNSFVPELLKAIYIQKVTNTHHNEIDSN